jgi:hypothetical protein
MRFELDQFNRHVPDQELLDDLKAANVKAAGKPLTFRSYREFGRYSPSTICERFGSWNNALIQAGLVPAEEKFIPIEALFDNLKIVWIAKGRQPVYRDMSAPPSQYTGSTYNARFGGWRKALAEFVATVNKEQFDSPIPTVVTKLSARTARDPSLSLRFLVLKRDNFRCVACGRSPATVAGLVLEVDHILAWSNGGETVTENLQSLCFDCNRGKGVL